MPATIQEILKPTKYRAIDTSTGDYYVDEYVVDGNFSSASNWNLGDDWSISNNELILTHAGDTSGNVNQSADSGGAVGMAMGLTKGTYQLTWTISAYAGEGSVTARIFGLDSERVPGSARSSNGTFTEILTLDGTNPIDTTITDGLQFRTNPDPTTDQVSLKITNVSLKKLESIGNNNHGQIYSGRALEFDGVSDYLDTGMAFSETNCTVAVWAYIDDLGAGADIICARDSDDEGIVIRANSAEQILFKVGDGSTTNTITSSRSYKNTWIRIVGTYDGSTQRLYINGVEAGSASISITIPSVTSDVFIGARSFTSQINMFSGKLSDVQLWNATWSASDALYDYLNPESLALNNGGTSLTESNLKLWYPMNDGHRGSDGVNDGKHFIMDGANTGLGDDIVNWTSTFSGTGITTDGNVGSWVSNAGDSGDTHTYIDNDNKTIRLKSDDGAHVHLKILNSLTPGVAYKFVVTVDSISGKFRIRPGDNEPDADMTTTGTHSFYFASSESTYWRIERDSGVGDMTVSDIKIYPINEKHHATSEFFDELVTEGDFSNGGAAWSTSGSTITTAINGGAFVSTGDADGGFGTCSQSETLIEGRTYKLEFEVTAITGTPSVHNYCGALTKSLGTASVTTFTDTFVASSSDATAGGIDVRTICANGESVTIDNISFKEVGVATGWSEASQELDIPQTALQSYNQLAWFPGTDSGTDFDINCGKDSTIDDIFNGGGTVSAWIYPVGSDAQWIVHKGHGTSPTSGWYIGIQNLSSGKYVLRLDASFNGTSNGRWDTDDRIIKQGAWNHIAVNWNDDSTDNNPTIFVNGESVDVDENEEPDGAYNSEGSRDFLIGNSHDGTNPFGGAITEVSLWDTGLSIAQVGELYNDGKALDALTHSLASSNLKAYWRNNGLATWKDLKNSNDGTVNNVSETILIPAGVDASRDTQGFIMNRQKDTNALNLPEEPSGVRGSSNSGPYVFIPKAPVQNASSTVTNFSFSLWMKLTSNPSDILSSLQSVRLFDDSQATARQGLRVQINNNNVLYTYLTWGSGASESIYTDYALGNLNNSTVTNPHSFGADGEWNGTQTSMGGSVGVNQYANGPVDEWIHYAVTFDHDREESQTTTTGDHTSYGDGASNNTNRAPFYVFINGIIVAKEGKEADDNEATATSRAMQAGNNPILIGNDMNGTGTGPGPSGATFPGHIDDLLFYSDTLTAKEVLRIYNAGKRSHK